MDIKDIIIKEHLYTNIECSICYELFIDTKGKDYWLLLDEIENKYNQRLRNELENKKGVLLLENKFECLVCKNIICRGCIWSLESARVDADPDMIDMYENGLVDDGYSSYDGKVDGYQGEDGPIICPFCKTKDFRDYNDYNKVK